MQINQQIGFIMRRSEFRVWNCFDLTRQHRYAAAGADETIKPNMNFTGLVTNIWRPLFRQARSYVSSNLFEKFSGTNWNILKTFEQDRPVSASVTASMSTRSPASGRTRAVSCGCRTSAREWNCADGSSSGGSTISSSFATPMASLNWYFLPRYCDSTTNWVLNLNLHSSKWARI